MSPRSPVLRLGLAVLALGAIYQGLYRDAAATFCNPGTFNLTSAVSVVW